MADIYRIDSHKLIYHPHEVSNWLKALGKWELLKKIYPIYIEISPVSYCNHRCKFCALDYLGYKKYKLDTYLLKDRISEMAKLGIKSIMFGGEGEPSLHNELPEIIDHCSKVGIDVAITTNFVLLNESKADIILKNCKWIKVSINAGTSAKYSKIHRTQESDFDRVINNLSQYIKIRNNNNYSCTIGIQMLLLSDNYDTAENLTGIAKDLGVDYIVFKPYSHHLSSITTEYRDIDYKPYYYLEEILKKYEDSNFDVIFRIHTMKKLENKKIRYKKCNAVPFFWSYICANGDVYGCSAFIGNSHFCYGNILINSFQDIWEGEKRKKGYEHVQHNLGIENCRLNCRMDEINRYLWELINPNPHVNFI